MRPGQVIHDDDPAQAVARFVADDVEAVVVFEAAAGGEPPALDRYRAARAALAAALGPPLDATRAQGLPGAPAAIEPRWTRAARCGDVVVTLSGEKGGAWIVGLAR